MLMPIGAKLYEQAQKEAKPEEGEAKSDKKDDDPIEGEVIDEK